MDGVLVVPILLAINQLILMMKNTIRATTWVELLRERVQHSPDNLAYTFLVDGDITKEISLTYQELEQKVQAIAAKLQSLIAPGDRVLLLYPQGIDYVAGFLGCLYAGVIAIPIFQPRGKHSDIRIQAIADDAQAKVALTTNNILSNVAHRLDDASPLKELQWLATDNISIDLADTWQQPDINSDTLAFLQYTSGSTGIPKGVMVSHGNLLHNSAYTASIWQYNSKSIMVTWLPIFHDMGLIFGILQPIYKGFPCYLMSPATFVQRPFRWLQAISHYKATHSGAPNFAYDLCVQKISAEQRASLDLSSWCMSLNAAEPVRAETFQQFIKVFKPCGLQPTTICHGYGLAEATLIVAGAWKQDMPVYYKIQSDALEQHKVVAAGDSVLEVQTLVGSGYPAVDAQIVIANPATLSQCSAGEVGEIWVSSPSVAHGYWQRPLETAETFQAYLRDTGAGPFLRTGDLGFLRDGELFVTGRIKDVIIIRGNNYYPQDIEFTVEKSHPMLRQVGYGAAFAVEVVGQEQLVVTQEVERSALKKLNGDEVASAIRQAVSEEHDLQIYAILLLKPATIPRTSSGKIQRSACRTEFLESTLKTIATWQQPIIHTEESTTSQDNSSIVTAKTIQNWLVNKLSQQLKIAVSKINILEPFSRYGFDSITATSLSGELEIWLKRSLSPTIAYNYPNIHALSQYLAGESQPSPKKNTNLLEPTETIAIIGMACRFPNGANNPEAYWSLLRNGIDAISEIPKNRWDKTHYYEPEHENPGKISTNAGGFLDKVDQFDAAFFRISPREAEGMDPQQRFLLEVNWEALEQAGLSLATLEGSQTGIFTGIFSHDYETLQIKQNTDKDYDSYFGTGNSSSIAAGRLAYFFDFQGPAISIDTACSSSLVAVHLACQSLRNRECDLALASGVNLLLSPELSITFSSAGMLAPDGRCKTFDASANGYVRGEGCAAIVLKRLPQALADNDNILAIIRSSAINQDGTSNGLTAPNGLAQEAVIRKALSGIPPADISYVEAHGTGTSLGDPVEFKALEAVYGEDRTDDNPLFIGSVKTNIGHTEATAGLAGLLKIVLAMQHNYIPPHINFKTLNPYISLDKIPARIPIKGIAWKKQPDKQRLAGVSAFGFSGTNAHIILQDPPSSVRPKQIPERSHHLLTLSARTNEALRELAQTYVTYLNADEVPPLGDLCFTAHTGRTHFDHRLALVAESTAQICEELETFVAEKEKNPRLMYGQIPEQSAPKIAFLFTGQGAQYVGMGQQLYETQPHFRQTIDFCDEILRPYLGKPLLEVLYQTSATEELNETTYTQPALFAIEYALAELWQSWGIQPNAVMGHSVGEYVAACIAGVFSLEDGLKLIAERGRLMQALPRSGEMVVVRADEEVVKATIQPYAKAVSIAAVNGPTNIVISGESQAVKSIVADLEKEGIKTTYLKVSHAFHSPLMEPILKSYAQIASEITYAAPQIDLISNVTGNMTTAVSNPEYWVKHIRQPVRFAPSMETLRQLGCQIFVEIGPKPVLLGMGRHCVPEAIDNVWLPSLRQGVSDWQQLFQSLGTLYLHDIQVDWASVDRDYPRRRVSLPTYPFQRQRYWIKTATIPRTLGESGTALHPLWERKLQSPLLKETVFETQFSATYPSFIADHVIFEKIIVPGASHISMLLGAAGLSFGDKGCVLENIIFLQALIIQPEETRTVQVLLAPENESSQHTVKLISFVENSVENNIWIEHVTCMILTKAPPPEPISIQALQARCLKQMPGTTIYQTMQQHQFQLGADFRWVDSIWQGDDEILCRMKWPESVENVEEYQLHPGLIDSCFQPFFLTLSAEEDLTFVPFSVEKFAYYQHPDPAAQLWCHATFRKPTIPNKEQLLMDTCLCDETGQVLAEAIGLELRKGSRNALLRSLEKNFSDLLYEITWQPVAIENKEQNTKTGRWLIFADRKGIGVKLAERLQAQGESCVVISHGDTYQRLGAEHYSINPVVPEDFTRLLRDSLFASDILPCRGIVHLWSLDTAFTQITNTDDLQNTQILGCGSVLHLIQSMVQSEWDKHPPRISLITRGAQPIDTTASYPLQAQQASLWGLGGMIALEYPDLHCLRVDLDPSEKSDIISNLFESIWQTDKEDRIAYRQNTRYVARLARTNQQSMQVLSINGSYLITGGLGGLGLKVADWLAGQGAKHLFLIGRSTTSETARNEINRLEQAGTRVTVMSADVSKPDDIAQVFETIKASSQPLRGVIHTAGVLEDALLQKQNWTQFSRVMAPKVAGAWNLHNLTQDIALDFFVCFSSSTALLGAAGQGNYAAANAFMDGLVQHRRDLGLPGLSINWGPWGEIGMAAALDTRDQARWSDLGIGNIAPTQGVKILERLLTKNTAQMAVLPVNWLKFLQQFQKDAQPPFFDAFKQVSEKPSSAQPSFIKQLEATPAAKQRDLLLGLVRSQIGKVARLRAIEQIQPRQRLFDFGLDSLMAVELKNNLQTSMGQTLRATLVFDYPTIEALVNHLFHDILELSEEKLVGEKTEPVEEEDSTKLEELSKDEIDALLDDKLAELDF